MIFRPQRGSLAKSMEDAVSMNPTRRDLAAYLGEPITDIQVRMYGYDGAASLAHVAGQKKQLYI
jgi:hypothetical protein